MAVEGITSARSRTSTLFVVGTLVSLISARWAIANAGSGSVDFPQNSGIVSAPAGMAPGAVPPRWEGGLGPAYKSAGATEDSGAVGYGEVSAGASQALPGGATDQDIAPAGLICTPADTADFIVLQYDIKLFPTGAAPVRMEVTIRNLGVGVNQDFIYYDIYELDSSYNRIAHIKKVNTSSVVPVGGQVMRTIAFVASQVHQGTTYEVYVRYVCDPDNSNNFLYQTAFNIGGLPGEIMRNGFESPSLP